MWSLLFPAACAACGEDVPPASEVPGFCSACEEQLVSEEASSRCRWCTARLSSASHRDRCSGCSGWPEWLGPVVSLGAYRGQLRRAVLRSKTVQGEFLCAALARLMVQRCRDELLALHPQLVVPVPMHWTRRWHRGTNPAETLACVLAPALGIPWAEALRRVRATPRQSRLPASLRRRNVQGAFGVRRGKMLQRRRVLLVDDVMATGATVWQAARAARNAGAQRVAVALLARAQHPRVNAARN